MAETFRGTRTLRFLWYLQRGLCPVCNTKMPPQQNLWVHGGSGSRPRV
jgi:hypothetical protein